MVRGCACSRAISYDNVFYRDYDPYQIAENPAKDVVYWFMSIGKDGTNEELRQKFHRGPNSWSSTDFYGYNCLLKRCPRGDNPRTRGIIYICLNLL